MKHSLATRIRLLAIATIAVLPLFAAPLTNAAPGDSDATMSVSGGSNVTAGSNMTFTVYGNHGSNPINTWKGYLLYPTSVFSGGTVTNAPGSPFNVKISAETKVTGGAISFVYYTTDGTDDPSLYNYSGPIANVTLNSIAAGSAAITFEHKCTVAGDNLCNAAWGDGNIGNMLTPGVGTGATYTVTAPASSGGGGTTTGGGTTSGGGTSTSKGGTASKPSTGTTKPTTPSTTTPTTPGTTPPATTTDPNKPTTTDTTSAGIDAKVTLTLLDQNGKPVVGAKVTVDGETGTTDKDGKVTLTSVTPGPVTGKVTYKGETKSISLNVSDGSVQPTQSAKITLKVKKSSAAAPIAITVGTLAVVAGAAFVLAGPSGGLGSLINKLPGMGGGPKPPAPTAGAGPTPPVTPPTPPAPTTTPPASASVESPKAPEQPHTILPKHVDPTAPGTTFTPNHPTIPSI